MGDTLTEIEKILEQVGGLFPVIQAVDPALSPLGALLPALEQILLGVDGAIRGTAATAGHFPKTPVPTPVLSAPGANPANG